MSVLKSHTVVVKGEKGQRDRFVINCTVEEGMTKQKTGYEHDINKVVAKFKKTGMMPKLTSYGGDVDFAADPVFDCVTVGDFQDCQERILQGQALFDMYPSQIRRYFDNDMRKFVQFLGQVNTDPAKKVEAVRLGIIDVRPESAKPAEKPVEPTGNKGVQPTGDDKK